MGKIISGVATLGIGLIGIAFLFGGIAWIIDTLGGTGMAIIFFLVCVFIGYCRTLDSGEPKKKSAKRK